MLKLPQFYGNVITAFNSCKKQKVIGNLTRDEFLSQFIWNNRLFQYDSKPLIFNNWIRSGILYVNDIFDETGELFDITYFSNKLIKKNNILCEYLMLKKAVKMCRQKFDCSYAKYVNIRKDVHFFV